MKNLVLVLTMDPIVFTKHHNINDMKKLLLKEDNLRREKIKRTSMMQTCNEVACMYPSVETGVNTSDKCANDATQRSSFFDRAIPELVKAKKITNRRGSLIPNKKNSTLLSKSNNNQETYQSSADCISNIQRSQMGLYASPVIKQHKLKSGHPLCEAFDANFAKQGVFDRFSTDFPKVLPCNYVKKALVDRQAAYNRICCVPRVLNNFPDTCKKKIHSRTESDSYDSHLNTFEKKENASVLTDLERIKMQNLPLRSNINQTHLHNESLEVKYKNNDFRNAGIDIFSKLKDSNSDTEIEQSYFSEYNVSHMNKSHSSDEISLPEEFNVSAHSVRSKMSTLSKKNFNILLNLENSKCDALSVIDDCLSRESHSRKETRSTIQLKNSRTSLDGPSHTSQRAKQEAVVYNGDVISTDFLNDMFKEYRGYHLENMKQEIKRIQYLDSLPQKLVKKA